MVAFPFTFKPAICNFEAKKLLWVTFPTVAASFLYQHAANTPVDKLPTEPEHLAQGETANISIALDDLLGRLKSRYTRLLQKEMSKVLEQIATTMMKKTSGQLLGTWRRIANGRLASRTHHSHSCCLWGKECPALHHSIGLFKELDDAFCQADFSVARTVGFYRLLKEKFCKP